MKMPRLKIAKLCLCIGVLLTSSVRPAEIEAGFTPLFNTANASGWVLRGDEKLAIENGIATLSGPEDRRGTAWYMKKEFGDFVLRAEFMGEKPEFRGYLRLRFADPATYSEPGVSPPNYAASGFGVVLCDPQDPWKYKTGAINEWQEPKSIPFKTEDWNEIEVSAIGQNYSVKLNGILINEFVGKKRLRGYLGLEENRRGALRFRNMCIKEILPPPLATIPSTSPQMIMTVEPQNLEDALLTYRWSWINNVPEPKKPMHRDKEVRFYKNGTALSSFHEVWNWKLTGPQSIQLVFEDGGFQRDSGISIFYSPGFTNFSYKDGRITGSRLGAVAPTTPCNSPLNLATGASRSAGSKSRLCARA